MFFPSMTTFLQLGVYIIDNHYSNILKLGRLSIILFLACILNTPHRLGRNVFPFQITCHSLEFNPFARQLHIRRFINMDAI